MYGGWVMLESGPADQDAADDTARVITAITVWHLFDRVGEELPTRQLETFELPRDSRDKRSRACNDACFSQF